MINSNKTYNELTRYSNISKEYKLTINRFKIDIDYYSSSCRNDHLLLDVSQVHKKWRMNDSILFSHTFWLILDQPAEQNLCPTHFQWKLFAFLAKWLIVYFYNVLRLINYSTGGRFLPTTSHNEKTIWEIAQSVSQKWESH